MEENIKNEITRLKSEKGVYMISHYCQSGEIHELSDRVCGAFEMAQAAAEAVEETVLICGTRQAAETVKVLNPEKRVLIPRLDAECAMSGTVSPRHIASMRRAYPDAAVVCYVNSNAEAKAASDVCCTASNAIRVVKALKAKRVIFVPDANLAGYVASKVPEKEIVAFSGGCPVHCSITAADVTAARIRYPGAKLLFSPQCAGDVLEQADFVGSSGEIIAFAGNSLSEKFAIGTEGGVTEYLRGAEPGKEFYPLKEGLFCPDMGKITPDDLLNCLMCEEFEIFIPPDELRAARRSMERMFAVVRS